MKLRSVIIYLIIVTLILGVVPCNAAPGKSLPLVVVFSEITGIKPEDGNTPMLMNMDVIAETIQELRSSGKVDILAFNPELPVVARAVMEKRLKPEMLANLTEPASPNLAKIAGAIGGAYALFIRAPIMEGKIHVTLDLAKAPTGERWSGVSESIIAGGRGPRSDTNRRNAVLTAVSAAVSQIMIQAFGKTLEITPPTPVVEAPPAPVNEVIPAPDKPKPDTHKPPIAVKPQKPVRDIDAEYLQVTKNADAYETKNDLPNAIVELKKAVNLDPFKPEPRVKIAAIYEELGMITEAIEEYEQALLFNKDNPSIINALGRMYAANGDFDKAAVQLNEVVRLDSQNIEAQLILGDMYWNDSEIDKASEMYVNALKLAPQNPAVYERLARLYTARKAYDDALQYELSFQILLTGKQLDDVGRYRIVAKLVKDEFESVLGKLQASFESYKLGRISKDDVYQDCKDITSRVDALAAFLPKQVIPGDYAKNHPHGVMATSLLSQASGYMLSYLETEKTDYMEQSELLQSEAGTELNLYLKGISIR